MKKNKDNDNTLGKFVRIRRRQLGMSQLALAEAVGYQTKAAISKIELGENDIPMSKLNDFAIALNCSPAELIHWTPIDIDLTSDQAVFDAQILTLHNQLSLENKDLIIALMKKLIKSQDE